MAGGPAGPLLPRSPPPSCQAAGETSQAHSRLPRCSQSFPWPSRLPLSLRVAALRGPVHLLRAGRRRPINQSLNSKQMRTSCLGWNPGLSPFLCGCRETRPSQVIQSLTGPGLDPPEGDDNIFFPVLPRRQGGVLFFQPSLLGPGQTHVYSVRICRPVGLGKPGRRPASSPRGSPAGEHFLPQDSVFLTALHEAPPEETHSAWTWLKAGSPADRLGPHRSSDISRSPSVYTSVLFWKQGSQHVTDHHETRSKMKYYA